MEAGKGWRGYTGLQRRGDGCIYSQVEAQSPNAGTGKPRVVFLNREAEFGPRRIDNLKFLANERSQSWSMEKEYSIEYVDGLINLDMQSQLLAVTKNTAMVISPHGSQLT